MAPCAGPDADSVDDSLSRCTRCVYRPAEAQPIR